MISASLAVEGPPRGLGLPGPGHIDHHHHHAHHAAALHAVAGSHHPGATHPPFVSAYHHHAAPPPPPTVEAWRGVTTSKQEFLRPLPKPLTTRYNGMQSTTISNNTSNINPLTSIRSNRSPKYSPPATNTNNSGPVNLVQHKSESPPVSTISITRSPPQEDMYPAAGAPYSRLFPGYAYPSLAGAPYGVYTSPYTQILSRQAHLEPSTFLTPPQPSAYSPSSGNPIPSAPSSPLIKPCQTQLKERRVSAPTTSISLCESAAPVNFKVPSGKEGSLKHRILTRPNDTKKTFASSSTRTLHTNNNTISGGFAKGSLIELGNGELRRIEDMRTEDFILSAELSPELRLTNSTVIRIEENPILGSAIITLSYNQNQQVEFESSLEHPLFVYGHGWASCAPERTLQCYGLKCHPLRVGDICVSFVPRETPPAHINPVKNATITTTATTTAMTPRQISQKTNSTVSHLNYNPSIVSSVSHIQPPRTHSAEEIAAIEASNARKRRWSAPDQICEDDEIIPMRRIKE